MHCRDGLSLGMGCCYHTFSSIFNSLKCSHRLSREVMNWKGARQGLHVEPASMYCMPGSRFKSVFFWLPSIHIDHMIPATPSLVRTAAAISSIKKTVGQSCRIGVSQRYMIRMWSRFFPKGWGLLNFIEHWVLFTPLFCSCDVSRGSCC